MNEWMSEWMDAWMNEWMMNERMNGWTPTRTSFITFHRKLFAVTRWANFQFLPLRSPPAERAKGTGWPVLFVFTFGSTMGNFFCLWSCAPCSWCGRGGAKGRWRCGSTKASIHVPMIIFLWLAISLGKLLPFWGWPLITQVCDAMKIFTYLAFAPQMWYKKRYLTEPV